MDGRTGAKHHGPRSIHLSHSLAALGAVGYPPCLGLQHIKVGTQSSPSTAFNLVLKGIHLLLGEQNFSRWSKVDSNL